MTPFTMFGPKKTVLFGSPIKCTIQYVTCTSINNKYVTNCTSIVKVGALAFVTLVTSRMIKQYKTDSKNKRNINRDKLVNNNLDVLLTSIEMI